MFWLATHILSPCCNIHCSPAVWCRNYVVRTQFKHNYASALLQERCTYDSMLLLHVCRIVNSISKLLSVSHSHLFSTGTGYCWTTILAGVHWCISSTSQQWGDHHTTPHSYQRWSCLTLSRLDLCQTKRTSHDHFFNFYFTAECPRRSKKKKKTKNHSSHNYNDHWSLNF